MRLFLAVELPEAVRRRLSETSARLGRRFRCLRVVPEGNLHLTLRFLGEIQPSALEPLGANLERALAPRRAFGLTVKGLGLFPGFERPRILWAGIASPQPVLELAADVLECSRGFGEPERKPFRAHVTLARLRREPVAPELRGVVDNLGSEEFGAASVDEVVLFESRLTSPAPEYRSLRRFRLAAGERRDVPS